MMRWASVSYLGMLALLLLLAASPALAKPELQLIASPSGYGFARVVVSGDGSTVAMSVRVLRQPEFTLLVRDGVIDEELLGQVTLFDRRGEVIVYTPERFGPAALYRVRVHGLDFQVPGPPPGTQLAHFLEIDVSGAVVAGTLFDIDSIERPFRLDLSTNRYEILTPVIPEFGLPGRIRSVSGISKGGRTLAGVGGFLNTADAVIFTSEEANFLDFTGGFGWETSTVADLSADGKVAFIGASLRGESGTGLYRWEDGDVEFIAPSGPHSSFMSNAGDRIVFHDFDSEPQYWSRASGIVAIKPFVANELGIGLNDLSEIRIQGMSDNGTVFAGVARLDGERLGWIMRLAEPIEATLGGPDLIATPEPGLLEALLVGSLGLAVRTRRRFAGARKAG